MISVITVFNQRTMMMAHLYATLQCQDAEFEFIAIDNSQNVFPSAAAALNEGASRSRGDVLVFAHQDMRLLTPSTLRQLAHMVTQTKNVGIAGVAGVTQNGEARGWMLDSYRWWGQRDGVVQPVQTVDECLVSIPRAVFEQVQFDAALLDGWHCYAVDYCLAIRRMGLSAYVLPLDTHHVTLATNTRLLCEYQAKVWLKHQHDYPLFFTTCGPVNPAQLMRRWWSQQLSVSRQQAYPQHLLRAMVRQPGIKQLAVVVGGYNFPVQQVDLFGVDCVFMPPSKFDSAGAYDGVICSRLPLEQPLPPVIATLRAKRLALHFSLAHSSRARVDCVATALTAYGFREYAHSPQEMVWVREGTCSLANCPPQKGVNDE